MRGLRSLSLLVGMSLVGAACGGPEPARPQDSEMTWEEFRALAYQEPFEGGKLIVNGDEAFASEQELKAYYDHHIASDLGRGESGLAIYYLDGDVKWSTTMARGLTYCVSSSSFGSRYSTVVSAMASASAAWEAAANVNFIHSSTYDSNCTASQTGVVFDVRMVSGQAYLARAFFPNTSRSGRNILIDSSAFGGIAPLTLTGLLRHELGHTLGFIHENDRPESRCGAGSTSYRALTPYDPHSVMHLPCGGLMTSDHILSSYDRSGASSIYP